MQVINTRFEPAVPIHEIRCHPQNARTGDVGAIYQSIEANGFYGACVVQESTGYILAGNHRFQAAQHAGAADVPVIFIDCDDERALRILLADNRTADLADWDVAGLAELLREFAHSAEGLLGTGFDAEAMANVERDLAGYKPQPEAAAEPYVAQNPEVSAPDHEQRPAGKELEPSPADQVADEVVDKRDELLAKWGTALGQVWRIGSLSAPGSFHRLLCGDSTKPEDLDRVLDGAIAAGVWTDPPYGVNYKGKTAAAMEIENDGAMGLDDLLAGVFSNAHRVMAEGAPIYVAHPHGPLSLSFGRALVESGFRWHETLVWVKNAIVLDHSDYHYRHEPILYGWKGKNRPWFGDRNKSTVLEYPKPSRSDMHPTTKPTALIAHCLENSSAPGALWLEPFSGSGATLLAGEQTGRLVAAVELDPRYVAVALERLEMAGLKPELVA